MLALLLSACGAGSGLSERNGPGIDTLTVLPRVADYIRSDDFSRLVLEVDYVEGFAPRASTQSDLSQRLEALLDKPDGVAMVLDGTIASRGSEHAWTFGELDALMRSTFDHSVPANTIKMHVLFVDGHYDTGPGGGTVLGVAWDNLNMVIFKQVIEDNCAAADVGVLTDAACAAAELAICVHEVGHIIGLVDGGLPMVTPHEDPDHPGHDRSSNCVMYWAYEGDALISRVADDLLGSGGSALDFDEDCRADIAAVRDAP